MPCTSTPDGMGLQALLQHILDKEHPAPTCTLTWPCSLVVRESVEPLHSTALTTDSLCPAGLAD